MDIKKTAFGTAAAAALIVAGTAAPAMASGGWSHSGGDYSYDYDKTTTSINKWSSYESHKTTTISPEVNVLNGDILNGNLSGNETNTPILSGNETAVGNGNETAIGNVSDSGNGNAVGNVVGNETGNVTGNDVLSENHVSDVVDNVTETSVKDIVDVDDIIGDVSGWVNVKGIFED
jgi:hypothetical protein